MFLFAVWCHHWKVTVTKAKHMSFLDICDVIVMAELFTEQRQLNKWIRKFNIKLELAVLSSIHTIRILFYFIWEKQKTQNAVFRLSNLNFTFDLKTHIFVHYTSNKSFQNERKFSVICSCFCCVVSCELLYSHKPTHPL